MGCQAQLPISFGSIGVLFIEYYIPFVFLKSWALVFPYVCSKFHIFDKLVLEEYVF